MSQRRYRLGKRALQQEQTRQRIVEAAMALHEEVGPLYTSISAVAERAGVQRLTVYRHFPDEHALFAACTRHWLSLNPPPDPETLAHAGPRRERGRLALQALYAYYRGTRRMWHAAHRDVEQVPALQEPMQGVQDYLAAVLRVLAPLWAATARGEAPALATLGLALAFGTWEHLEERGLDDAGKARLADRWLRALA